MSTRKPQNQAPAILLLALAALYVGCGPSGYREPVTKFQDASAVVLASSKIYLSELNKVERDSYILSQASKKAQIKTDEIEAVQVFSQEALQARLDALDQLATYGDLLSKLANSNAPEKLKTEASDLGTAVSNLSVTVGKLTGADDAKFKSAVSPVATILGEITSLIVNQKIQDALDKAINKGETAINELLVAIKNDMLVAYARKRTSFSNTRVLLVDDYNAEFQKGNHADPEKLRMYAERIREHEDRWAELGNANPAEAIDAMSKAHSALVKYAKSGHKVNDLASLVDAMEAFATRAKSILQAVQALRTI
jgi:hypothetical protein